MKFRHKPTVIDAVKFRPGMETGIDEFVQEGREPWDRTTVEYPYIIHNYQKIRINFGDWLVTESDGNKYAMTNSMLKKYFDVITDEVDLKLSRIFNISE